MILIAVVALVVGFVLGTAYANLIMQEIKCEAGEVFASPDSIKSNPAPSGEELDEKDFVSEWEVVDDLGLTIKMRYYRTEVEGEFVHKVIPDYSSVILPEGGILVDGDDEQVTRKPISEDTAKWIEECCAETKALRQENLNKHQQRMIEVAAKRCNKIWEDSKTVWEKIEETKR